jgi:hypothetical protein
MVFLVMSILVSGDSTKNIWNTKDDSLQLACPVCAWRQLNKLTNHPPGWAKFGSKSLVSWLATYNILYKIYKGLTDNLAIGNNVNFFNWDQGIRLKHFQWLL